MAIIHDKLKPFKTIPLNGKKPFWDNWPNLGKSWNDPIIQAHISNGGNYGVLTGNGLIVIDVDSQGIEVGVLNAVKTCLPRTFTVKTAGNGFHFYYYCKMPPLRLSGNTHDDIIHVGEWGDVKSTHGQVVGPSSHFEGKTYIVFDDIPIHQVTQQDVEKCLSAWTVKPKTETYTPQPRRNHANHDARLTDELSLTSFKRSATNPNEYVGPNPTHNSETGRDMSLNANTGLWYCHRCNSGGGVFKWIAVREGLISCTGTVNSDLFEKVLNIWRGKK